MREIAGQHLFHGWSPLCRQLRTLYVGLRDLPGKFGANRASLSHESHESPCSQGAP